MVALGNGRRGGRSPSLLVTALIACILLLGFNYWVSNSRNIELQSKILELEDRMRLLAADRDKELQNKMHMQNERMELIEDTHRKQQDTALNSWKQEKDILNLNISSSAKTMQEMKNRMKSLFEDLSKRQNELKSCESNADTFMTQCNKKIETMEDKCSEKTAESKLEKKIEKTKTAPVALQNVAGSAQKLAIKAKSELPATNHSEKNVAEPSNSKPEVESDPINEMVQNNEKLVEKADVNIEKPPTPNYKSTNGSETLDRPDSNKFPEAVMDIKEESLKTDTLLDEAGILEPKDDDIGIGDGNEEKDRIGEDDAIVYDNDEELEKQLSKIKDENQGAGQDLEDEMANYNGDDDNQPESEDEKQAELGM